MAVAGVAAVLSLAYQTVTARFLGPAEYGDLWASLSLVYFFTVVINPIAPTVAGIVALLVERGRQRDVVLLRSQLLFRVAPIALLSIAAMALGALPMSSLLHLRSGRPLLIASFTIAIYALVLVDRGILQGARRFHEYNVNILLEASLRLLCAVALLFWIRSSATMAMLAYGLAVLAAEVLLLLLWRRRVDAIDPVAFPWDEFRRIGAPIVMLMFALAVYQNIDTFAVKRFAQATDAGLYAAAAALSRTFTVILGPIYVFAVPTLAAVRERGGSVMRAGLRLCGAYLALAAIPLVVIGIGGGVIVDHLYGPTFAGAVPLLLPLSGIVILGNLVLLGAQMLATAQHLPPIWGYLAIAVAEVIALMQYHPSIHGVIVIGYLAQGSAALVVASALLWTNTHDVQRRKPRRTF